MRHSAFIGFCLLVVAAFVVVPRCIRPFAVGMSEQRVTALLTNQWWFFKPRWFRDDNHRIFVIDRKFFVAEQTILGAS